MILCFLFWLFVLGLLYLLFSRQSLSSHPRKRRVRKPIASLTEDDCEYNMKNLRAPKATGLMFKLLVKLLYTRFGRNVIAPHIMKQSGLMIFDGVTLPDKPTYVPLVNCEATSVGGEDVPSSNEEEIDKLMKVDGKRSKDRPKPVTIADYIEGYQSHKFTPLEVITATLKCVETHDKILKSISQLDQQSVIKMASASTKRWKDNKPLSLLDGIPVVIKEQLKVDPHILRNGCVFVPSAAEDIEECTIAIRLREAGAIILGVTSMQEIGIGVLGSNPNHLNGTPRNPYNSDHYAGGSSTGSAIAVAAGFCPIAIGCDGGGSTRIPATLCGIVGLKPTFARFTPHGGIPLAFTVTHVGSLCNTVTDTAILYNIIGGRDPNCPITLKQPQLSLRDVSNMMLSDITIGIYNEWFEDADTTIVLTCKRAVKSLEALGANVVEIKIPELEETRVAHLLTIASEMSEAIASEFDERYNDYNLETLLAAVFGYSTTGVQYVAAQKQRTRSIESLKEIFKQVDCIVTPGTGCVAPKIPKKALARGESDIVTSGHLMKYSALGNFTGIPCVVVPVGYDKEGLPISLQIMGRWWEEHVILRVAHAVEDGIEYKPPMVHCNPLLHI